MPDTRFTTVAADVGELLRIVDVDAVDDIETLFMILFDLPIGVEAVSEDDEGEACLEVVVWTDDVGIGTRCAFPMSLLDLARECAETVAGITSPPSDRTESDDDVPADLLSMGEEELIASVRSALGEVRIFNLMSAEDA